MFCFSPPPLCHSLSPLSLFSFSYTESSVLLAQKCSLSIIHSLLAPLMKELSERAITLWQDEHYLLASWNKQEKDSGDIISHQDKQEKLAEVRVFAMATSFMPS